MIGRGRMKCEMSEWVAVETRVSRSASQVPLRGYR